MRKHIVIFDFGTGLMIKTVDTMTKMAQTGHYYNGRRAQVVVN